MARSARSICLLDHGPKYDNEAPYVVGIRIVLEGNPKGFVPKKEET